jgi:gliding motility-associated-like protein
LDLQENAAVFGDWNRYFWYNSAMHLYAHTYQGWKFLLTSILLLATAGWLRATHIVGGELNYSCLGNNQYEITLTIYRDCFYGNPNAYFDDPASIGVFDVNNVLLQNILVPLMEDDTLSPVLTNECLVVPPDVCVHTTTYRTIVSLPPVIGGYQLAYQRCCRNQTIANIVDPLATGATYAVTITEQALLSCNSSPRFSTWPPIYICANEPLIVDQSAFDIDGDSIVYRLCAPLEGATPQIPRPQPPNAPPYDPVVWVSPPYGVGNMLNGIPGGQVLQIDSQTGLLTALPTTIGQFVVGICVEEYRNGQLISTTRRDFQYNVGICGQSTAAFFAPEIQCGELTVNFDNQSTGSNQFRWEFNDPANPNAISTLAEPSYTFSDTGLYTIRLISGPGSVCADTFERSVYLQYNSLFPAFDAAVQSCGDSLTLQLTDLTTDTISSPVNWQWTSSTGQSGQGPSPVFTFYESGQVSLRLTVTAANGCQQTIVRAFNVTLVDTDIGNDSLFVCTGEGVALNPAEDDDYLYSWSPASSLSDASAANPFALPSETTTYQVIIRLADGSCPVERSVTVVVLPELWVEAPPDTVSCAPVVLLRASSNDALQYLWSDNASFSNTLSMSDSLLVSQFGSRTYYVLARNRAGCIAIDSVQVDNRAVNIYPLSNPITCLGNFIAIGVANEDPADTLSYVWSPANLVAFLGNTASPIVRPQQAGYQNFIVEATNQYGCVDTALVRVFAVENTDPLASFSWRQCGGYTVDFSSSSPNAQLYRWNFGIAGQTGVQATGPQVSFTFPGPGTYNIRAWLPTSLACADTLSYTLVLDQPPVNADFDWRYESCGDSAVVILQNTSMSQSAVTELQWLLPGGQLSEEETPRLNLAQTSSISVGLIIRTENGCTDTIRRELSVLVPQISLADSLTACAGQGVYLNPAADPAFVYEWSPAGLVDNPSAANPLASPAVPTLFGLRMGVAGSDCWVEGSVWVGIALAPDYILHGDSTSCGEEVLLEVQTELTAEVGWSDSPDFDEILAGTTGFSVRPSADATYYLQLQSAEGCRVVDSFFIDYQGFLVIPSSAVTICIGDTAVLGVELPLPGNYSFDWQPDQAIIAGEGSSQIVVSPLATTDYEASIVNEYGCRVDTSVRVTIFPYTPPLSIIPSIDTLFIGEQLQFIATQDTGYRYFWSPAELLDQADVFNPRATPTTTTEFQLVIRDPNGCINRATALIVVIEAICRDPYIFVPNAFTPNGDNINDVLRVEGRQLEEVRLVIYNRWGEQVFESRSQEEGWDGSYRAQALPADVYGYYLEVRCIGGERFVKKGNVTLIR